MADGLFDELGDEYMSRDTRAIKVDRIYTPREYMDNPVELRGLNEGYDLLRGAIIEQAIVDYMKSLRTIKSYPPEYRHYSTYLYRFGQAIDDPLEDYYTSVRLMRSWGVEFKIIIPNKDRWYGFTGKNLTAEQLEAIIDWQGEFYTRVIIQPNKISRGIMAVRKAYQTKTECKRFFNGKFYQMLCRIDKDYLLRIMKEKVEEEYETGTIPEYSRKTRRVQSEEGNKHRGRKPKHHRTDALRCDTGSTEQ